MGPRVRGDDFEGKPGPVMLPAHTRTKCAGAAGSCIAPVDIVKE